MLCRQVQRALSLALGATGDDVLMLCSVDAVDPAPNASHLLVQITLPRDATTADVLERIGRASATLRYEVAQAISRKRVPSLSWMPVFTPSPGTPGEGRGEGLQPSSIDEHPHPHPNPLPAYRERGSEEVRDE